jgi:23S rRNA (cytosine1962-C5)-methyltransferase
MSSLDQVPPPSTRRLAVRVTKDAIRQILGGHPWVFDRSIVSVNHEGASGDLAVIFDSDREFVAIGLYDPQSPIRIRVLHHGKPVSIDDAWWRQRVNASIERRQSVIGRGDTSGYRVIHGENDGLPGLVVDRYAATLVVKLYTTAWLPYLATLVPILQQRLAADTIVLRFSRDAAGQTVHGLRDGIALVGDIPTAPVVFRENGLTFEADVIRGQKTGHFLDQRENRARIRGLVRDAQVLDVFSSTGGFSVYAAAGAARSVHSVDISQGSIDAALRNMQHNIAIPNVQKCEHTTHTGDAFDVMGALAKQHRRFDVVIVDPPSFAHRNGDIERALHAYKRLTRLALDLLTDGGLLVQSSCSSRISDVEFFAAIHLAADSSRHRISEVVRTGHPADHPIGFAEGAYLKTMFARAHKRAEFGRR